MTVRAVFILGVLTLGVFMAGKVLWLLVEGKWVFAIGGLILVGLDGLAVYALRRMR